MLQRNDRKYLIDVDEKKDVAGAAPSIKEAAAAVLLASGLIVEEDRSATRRAASATSIISATTIDEEEEEAKSDYSPERTPRASNATTTAPSIVDSRPMSLANDNHLPSVPRSSLKKTVTPAVHVEFEKNFRFELEL